MDINQTLDAIIEQFKSGELTVQQAREKYESAFEEWKKQEIERGVKEFFKE